MSSPIHVVHTIHGTFSGIPSYSRLQSPSPYSPCAGVAMDMPDRPSSRLLNTAWHPVPVAFPSSCRRLSPDSRRHLPSLRASTAQPVHFPQEDDPFDDRHALPVHATALLLSIQSNQVVPYQRTRLASQSFIVKMPRPSPLEALVRQRTAQRLAQDREARCKAVAGILLNRVHAVGKPMRRAPPNLDAPRTYKRSRLSTMVTLDDL